MHYMKQSLELHAVIPAALFLVLQKSPLGVMKDVPTPCRTLVTVLQMKDCQELPVNSPKRVLPEDTHQSMGVSPTAFGTPGTSEGVTVKKPHEDDVGFLPKIVEADSSRVWTTVPSRSNRARATRRYAREGLDRGHK